MYYQLSTLALATLAAAAPTAPEAKSSTFRLVMPVNDVNMSLTAVQSKYKGALDIVALDAGTTGTPVVMTGKNPNAKLSFNITKSTDPAIAKDGLYTISIPDVGEAYGVEDPIEASIGATYSSFTVTDGEVFPKLNSAAEGWFACNTTVKGVQHYGLSWGVYNSNGSVPYGCLFTRVLKSTEVQPL